jgi:hypothetical protein
MPNDVKDLRFFTPLVINNSGKGCAFVLKFTLKYKPSKDHQMIYMGKDFIQPKIL